MIDDYNKYRCTLKDYFIVAVLFISFCVLVSYLFYQTFLAGLILSPSCILFYKRYQKHRMQKRKDMLTYQFKDAIQCLSSLLEAGYSMERAVLDSIHELQVMYDSKAYIVVEFQRISSLIRNNVPIEEAIDQFARRSRNEDIISFSEVYNNAKKSGGNLIEIMQYTSHTITEKIEIMREIQTMITAKKMEANIMKVMPFGLIIYLMICSEGFLDPLYGNTFGIVFMTIILLTIIGVSLIAEKIMSIEI